MRRLESRVVVIFEGLYHKGIESHPGWPNLVNAIEHPVCCIGLSWVSVMSVLSRYADGHSLIEGSNVVLPRVY